MAKKLPQPALELVASYSMSDLAADRDAQPRILNLIGTDDNDKVP